MLDVEDKKNLESVLKVTEEDWERNFRLTRMVLNGLCEFGIDQYYYYELGHLYSSFFFTFYDDHHRTMKDDEKKEALVILTLGLKKISERNEK